MSQDNPVSIDDVLDASMSERYPGWVHPLSVGPDERPDVTAANMEAIARHNERVAEAVALFCVGDDTEEQS